MAPASIRKRAAIDRITTAEGPETDTVEAVAEYTDIVQIGARNKGQSRPQGRMRTAAFSVQRFKARAAEGTPSQRRMILEKEVNSSFDDQTRSVIDLTAIPVLKSLSHLSIFPTIGPPLASLARSRPK